MRGRGGRAGVRAAHRGRQALGQAWRLAFSADYRVALDPAVAETADITINRTEQGKAVALKFNYNDVARGKNLSQNIVLKPGDTVVVP